MEVSKRAEMLKQFLMENDALPQYLFNASIYYSSEQLSKPTQLLEYICDNEYPDAAFTSAFVFSETPEGMDYWDNLKIKWTNKFKKVE